MAVQVRPDLIMMDIQLPVLDGYEAARRIKKDPMLARIPIIAVTSYTLFGDEAKTGRWLRWLYSKAVQSPCIARHHPQVPAVKWRQSCLSSLAFS
jgi:CheY-like chemotaxis protein